MLHRQNGPLVGPYGSTSVVEGELVREDGQLVSETDEERAAIEAWSRLWMAMSVRRLARQREAIEEGRASPRSSMRSAPALDGGPLSVRTRFNQGLAKGRAAGGARERPAAASRERQTQRGGKPNAKRTSAPCASAAATADFFTTDFTAELCRECRL